jgi:hypothetical protein
MNPAVLPDIAYNRYRHIGVDYGQVLFGFNTRTEFGANTIPPGNCANCRVVV